LIQITPYQLIQIHYESVIDWREYRDLLRVSKSFHNHPRNDFVLVSAGNGKIFFAQLLYLYRVTGAGGEAQLLALILPYDLHPDSTNATRTRDEDLGFTRLRSRKRKDAIFINIESVIWGAVLTQDYSAENPDEYIVMDLVCEEMWWRMKSVELLYSRA
jgi:hypothetical protein